METTLGKYSNSKLKDDTIDTKRDDLTKFQKHTTKVVKINAIGQIIAANYFEDNIEDGFKEVSSKSKHIVTLIDRKNLEYLISKFEEYNMSETGQSKVIQVLKSDLIVDVNLIDTIFAGSE
jgi:site-specific recombinase XerD